MANMGSKPVHTPRETAMHELLDEVRRENVAIVSDDEAVQFLAWAERCDGATPGSYHGSLSDEANTGSWLSHPRSLDSGIYFEGFANGSLLSAVASTVNPQTSEASGMISEAACTT